MKSHHVQVVAPDLAEQIRAQLEADGFRLGGAPYAAFEAVGSDVRVTYYGKRGKLLIQGAGTEGLLQRLAHLLPATADTESQAVPGAGENADAAVNEPTIGSDESGKGDYFGSLVVAACLVRPEDVAWLRRLGVRDSKEATRHTIMTAEGIILARLPAAVVEHEPPEYGRLHAETRNVNAILGRAHAQVIAELLDKGGCQRAIVDRFGGEHYVRDALGERAKGLCLRQIPRAEANPAVAAASFLARARFLRSLERLSDEVGVDLLPGAAPVVEKVARKVVAIGGGALLSRVAKMHFKTTRRVLR
ncbi:MAG: ribonuclease HIII [Planctomycetes bacterium]|nr:ribonuclease HIII [Planctomycetota bacterium]